MSKPETLVKFKHDALLLVLAFCMLQNPVWAQARGDAYQRGIDQMKAHDYAGAVHSLSEASGLNEADPSIYLVRGQAFYHLRQYQKAVADFDKSLDLKPANSDALLWKGTALAKAHEPKKATHAYLLALRNNPELVDQFEKGGGASNVTVNPRNEGAVLAYERAVKLYQSEGNANNLPDKRATEPPASSVHSDSILSKDALKVEDIDSAIKMDPSNAGLYFKRGQAYKRMGDLSRAIADYSDAIKLDPMVAQYYLGRARCYHERNQETLSQQDIKKAQSVDPKVPRRIRFVDE